MIETRNAEYAKNKKIIATRNATKSLDAKEAKKAEYAKSKKVLATRNATIALDMKPKNPDRSYFPKTRDCVNDDSTSDSYGDTCSSWYDDYEYEGSVTFEGVRRPQGRGENARRAGEGAEGLPRHLQPRALAGPARA